MLDDLRSSSTFIDEEEPSSEANAFQPEKQQKPRNEKFLGMTAVQRFILSLMILLMVCVLGVFALLFTGSITLPGM